VTDFVETALLHEIEEYEDSLNEEEIAASEEGWRAYLEGRTKPLSQVIKEQLDERKD
jgi:hypothetical protein